MQKHGIKSLCKEQTQEIKSYGDTVFIRQDPDIDIKDFVPGQDLVDQAPEEDVVALYIDKAKYWNFIVDEIQRAQSDIAIVDRWSTVATERMTFEYLPQPGLLARLGLQQKKYVVVGLFSGADALARALPGMKLVFIGTKSEREKLLQLRLPPRFVIADTSVQEAAALIDQAAAMVSLGTGTSHIAAHLRVPSVVLCNLSDPCWLPTYNPEVILLAAREQCGCRGDKTGECTAETPEGGVYRCLYYIKTADIVAGMRRLLPLMP